MITLSPWRITVIFCPKAIFDFHEESFANGLGKMIMDSDEVLTKPNHMDGTFNRSLLQMLNCWSKLKYIFQFQRLQTSWRIIAQNCMKQTRHCGSAAPKEGSRIISPRALDPRTLGPRTLDPRHPKSQGPVILGPMVLRTISPGILGPWKPWPLGPKVLWLKVLGPMVQGT